MWFYRTDGIGASTFPAHISKVSTPEEVPQNVQSIASQIPQIIMFISSDHKRVKGL